MNLVVLMSYYTRSEEDTGPSGSLAASSMDDQDRKTGGTKWVHDKGGSRLVFCLKTKEYVRFKEILMHLCIFTIPSVLCYYHYIVLGTP